MKIMLTAALLTFFMSTSKRMVELAKRKGRHMQPENKTSHSGHSH